MSTRCQVGFYETPDAPLSRPRALIYQHCDGYPDTDNGILATLLPWAIDFDARRGLSDAGYAGARALVALMGAAGALDDVLGYEVCGDHGLHGDIEFFYRVDPSGITVYRRSQNSNYLKPLTWHSGGLIKVRHCPLVKANSPVTVQA
jgi:hypothetical protein